jgi:hypothetical protein
MRWLEKITEEINYAFVEILHHYKAAVFIL